MNISHIMLIVGGFLMSSENTTSIQDAYQYDSQGLSLIHI